MGFPAVELIITLFFLFVTVLLSRSREQLRCVDPESYNYISGGVLTLTLVSLAQVYGKMGVFDTTPFLSDPLSFKVLSWIGVISGVIFVISGVSTWLPLSQQRRRATERRVERLDLIKRVEQLVGVETRVGATMSGALQYMVEIDEFSAGAAFLSADGRSPAELVAVFGDDESTCGDLSKIEIDPTLWRESRPGGVAAAAARGLPEGSPRPAIALPLDAGASGAGLFLLWSSDAESFDGETRMNLKLAVDVLARKFGHDTDRDKLAELEEDRLWRAECADAVDSDRDLKENLTALARRIGEKVSVDLISLTVLTGAGRFDRLTVGASASILSEIGLKLENLHGHARTVLDTGRSLIIDDSEENAETQMDATLSATGITTLIALPVVVAGSVAAILTAARMENLAFDGTSRRTIEAALPTLKGMVMGQQVRNADRRRQDRLKRITTFISDAARSESLTWLFQRAAAIMSQELGVVVARVSTFDRDGAFLQSRGLRALKPDDVETKRTGRQILALMPCHKLVHESGRTVAVREGDELHITPAEEKQAFCPGVTNALLVPIRVDDLIVGVASLADTGEPSDGRFGGPEREFVELMTGAMAAAVRFKYARQADKEAVEKNVPNMDSVYEADFRRRVKSSLTSILGSLDLLQGETHQSDEERKRYLSIIDRSARHIRQGLAESEPER